MMKKKISKEKKSIDEESPALYFCIENVLIDNMQQ